MIATFGAKSDSLAFSDYFGKFYTNIFFPYLESHKIDTIIHLGDVFDRRKYINYVSLAKCKEFFFDPASKYNFYCIAGNHDMPHRNSLKINSCDLLLKEYPKLRVIDKPTEIELDDTKIVLLPWICADNTTESLDLIEKTKAKILFGHLELAGFEMQQGSFIESGMDASLFSKFDLVASGHYHHRSKRDNIQYLGTQYSITWADYADPKGFHVFDTDTKELEFIENPYTMFHKLHYDDSVFEKDIILDFEETHIPGSYVKVIVHSKTDPVTFDLFMDKIEKLGPLNIQIVDDNLNLNLEDDEDLINEAESTLDILKSYIKNLETDADKKSLEKLISNLYQEAQNIVI